MIKGPGDQHLSSAGGLDIVLENGRPRGWGSRDMRDRDIREHLLKELAEKHSNEPGTLILSEMGLCQGEARVDVAVVNGYINGYEIKSARDTLERLPKQCETYCRVLDTVTLITTENHFDRLTNLVPEWWGIWIAYTARKGTIDFHKVRDSTCNPAVDPYAVAQLLWREELLELLRQLNLHRGMLSKSRRVLVRHLVANVELKELQGLVRGQLKSRTGWRSDLLRT